MEQLPPSPGPCLPGVEALGLPGVAPPAPAHRGRARAARQKESAALRDPVAASPGAAPPSSTIRKESATIHLRGLSSSTAGGPSRSRKIRAVTKRRRPDDPAARSGRPDFPLTLSDHAAASGRGRAWEEIMGGPTALSGEWACAVPGCGTAFGTGRSAHRRLVMHVRVVHAGIDVLEDSSASASTGWHCQYCGLLCASWHARDVHVAVAHQWRRFRCLWPACSFTAGTLTNLRDHAQESHFSSAYLCGCSNCGEILPTPGALRHHEMLVHGSDPSVRCPSCNVIFASARHLGSHAPFCGAGPYTFVCRDCGRWFQSERQLRMHARSHKRAVGRTRTTASDK